MDILQNVKQTVRAAWPVAAAQRREAISRDAQDRSRMVSAYICI